MGNTRSVKRVKHYQDAGLGSALLTLDVRRTEYRSWYWFTPVRADKLAFYALDDRRGEIGLLRSGWYG